MLPPPGESTSNSRLTISLTTQQSTVERQRQEPECLCREGDAASFAAIKPQWTGPKVHRHHSPTAQHELDGKGLCRRKTPLGSELGPSICTENISAGYPLSPVYVDGTSGQAGRSRSASRGEEVGVGGKGGRRPSLTAHRPGNPSSSRSPRLAMLSPKCAL